MHNQSNSELLAVLVGETMAEKLSKIPLSVLFGMRHHRPSTASAVCEELAQYVSIPRLAAAKELATRALLENIQTVTINLNNPKEAKDYCRLLLGGRQQEVFMVLFLDTQHRVIVSEEMFHGTLTQTSVYPREVVKRALVNNAAAVMLCHNHPSGLSEPSTADKLLTTALKQALTLVDVRVLDHFVIGDADAFSFAEWGLI